MSKSKHKSDCPINYAMEIFGDRWTFLIVRDLMFKGKSHYVEFLRSEEKIATNILAHRLQLLEDTGIVTKKSDPSHGSKWVYNLTPKGVDLMPLLVDMIIWSAKYDRQSAADKAFVRRAISDRDILMKEIRAGLKS